MVQVRSDGKRRTILIAGASLVVLLLLTSFAYLLLREEGPKGPEYSPSVDLPADYGVLMEMPVDEEGMLFSTMLSSLVVGPDGTYHPYFVLTEDGSLDAHQADTLSSLGLETLDFLLFCKDPEASFPAEGQVKVAGKYDMGPLSLGRFKGFDGLLTVKDHEEGLWAAPIARLTNKVLVGGPSTFGSQDEAWSELRELDVPFDYVMVVNPDDLSVQTLGSSPGYNGSDDKFHIPALSAVAGEVAAYRSAYVLTEYSPSTQEIGDMDLELNSRAIGYYLALKEASLENGIPTYVTLVGSASAVPQFQLPDQTSSDPNGVEGDFLVSSDVAYGFLGDDPYYMDSAVGRLVNLNVQGMSNQIVRTYMFDSFKDTVSVDYTSGSEEMAWRNHGTSFSGYEITYERGQVTPARFWCRDAEDEGMTYDYIGPTGVGRDILIGDGVDPKTPADMNAAMEASGFVAYRGHGSEYGSLYMVPYAVSGSESGVLRAEEVGAMLLPPQVGFWVACMNTKIHGAGWWKPAEPIEVQRTFALNYLYGGAIVAGGATEVSFSNIMQDTSSASEEWLPGVIVGRWGDGNYEWDLNDAWFAFFWDAVLNKEADHPTVGQALRWAENRYIYNPIHDKKVSPFIQELDDPDWQGGLLGAHWKEVSMFTIYGDPAFSPSANKPGENSYRPWVNGPEDTGEP